ncbi:hypothetical protein K432DRAFT_396166 [Lepidopterella palustris CBS 459.81]|uniref:Uncharacterized protein n=1 Tax=Lepidopterella palustris CBS 459.81 TaxID=1314670 RepID=A0A8E2E3N2_9PEZI|nr:hypothetical protein K432DRAFT_396166 [Lepidopterella palustris CBS 459.81]
MGESWSRLKPPLHSPGALIVHTLNERKSPRERLSIAMMNMPTGHLSSPPTAESSNTIDKPALFPSTASDLLHVNMRESPRQCIRKRMNMPRRDIRMLGCVSSRHLSNMVPINVGDVVRGVTAAQRLYSIGFRNVNNAGQKYRDFGEDIRLLAINLDLISKVVQRAQNQSPTFNGASRYMSPVPRPVPAAHQVLGNFIQTLNHCERLLDNQEYFTKRDGFVSIVSFYYQIDPQIQMLRDQIAFHNIKLSVSLKILDSLVLHLLSEPSIMNANWSSQILGDRFIQICDPTNAILGTLEQLGRQIRGEEERDYLPHELLGPVVIPRELEDGFYILAQEIFPDLSAIPLDRGIDAAVYYFNRVTKTPDQPIQSEIKYLITIIDIMQATWLLRAVKAGRYYHNATRYCSPNPVEQQLDRWGMTIERFFNKFEEVISSIT